MKNQNSLRFALGALLAGLAGAAPALAETKNPVVVELFTSQGCSSCPPANANLVKLSKEPDILALSFAVTYWDYLGWRDIFDKQEFTDRQTRYEPSLGVDGPFTPQMVINGRSSIIGQDLKEIRATIAAQQRLPGPALSFKSNAVVVAAGDRPKAAADIWLVKYDAGVVTVPVARGENAGEKLPHAHVVRELTRLGSWSGDAVSLPVSKAEAGKKRAVLVQEPDGGKILAALTD
ncbi:DUF1223 domain-containing protein [Rhizobium sp. XQZ8]|uniref:DUF1223 domain-containing protein n=1 Tax=Rhizobium populisoli TaxID=2859785 RepID=UPI001CA5C40F|nr:DUF1223 domain-containing protein [Rhizobium populisoli]MBW6420242.1 DUF1223 domain-containing protein [Rhizobium populisoli]